MKSLLKKLFPKKEVSLSDDQTGVHTATLNWFIHALIENIGYNEWVHRTDAEQKKYDEEHPHNKGYPFKVVTHPIPRGKTIVLTDNKTHTITCDSEETRNLLIEMARSYDDLEKKYYYLLHENASKEWHEAKELRPICGASSIRGPRLFFVSSPELCYVNGGTALGTEYNGKWYVFLNGKKIEHKVTHYRLLPPRPLFTVPPYEEVKAEVERLKKEMI